MKCYHWQMEFFYLFELFSPIFIPHTIKQTESAKFVNLVKRLNMLSA